MILQHFNVTYFREGFLRYLNEAQFIGSGTSVTDQQLEISLTFFKDDIFYTIPLKNLKKMEHVE